MKRYLSILLFTLFIPLMAFCQTGKQWIYVVVTSTDKAIVNDLPEIRSIMNQELNNTKQYRVRVTIPNGTDALSIARADELYSNTESMDYDRDKIVKFGKLAGANRLCVIQVSQMGNGEWRLSVDIFETEQGELITNDFYPNAAYPRDIPIKSIADTRAIQLACRYMLARMEFGDRSYSEIVKSEDRKALALSIIPGAGLIKKRRTGEGVAYLLGDIALVGGGVGMLAYANKQQRIMNDRNTTFNQYTSAKSNYNTAKTVSYCCFGAAAALYVVNLVRGYVAPNENPNFHVDIVPGMMPAISPYGPNMSVNLALAYKF